MARDIGEWLEGLGLGRYAEAFAENEIDLPALPHITEEDLKEIGVALGARAIAPIMGNAGRPRVDFGAILQAGLDIGLAGHMGLGLGAVRKVD